MSCISLKLANVMFLLSGQPSAQPRFSSQRHSVSGAPRPAPRPVPRPEAAPVNFEARGGGSQPTSPAGKKKSIGSKLKGIFKGSSSRGN